MEMNNVQPKDDEIEVSCFGPGFGESIAIHLGNGKWAIIDSCININDSLPTPVRYLQNMNVNTATQVKIILATHWHDDHIRGIADILSICKNATFYCSDALRAEEFRDLITAYGSSNLLENSGASELYKVMKILQKRATNKNLKFASVNKRIWFKSAEESPFQLNTDIWALSPSDASKLLALESISSLMPADFARYYAKQRIPDPKQNDVSVALWFSVGDIHFLFGSDLENNPNNNIGWKAVLGNKMRPRGKALFYKIAHHGAKSSHHDSIWKDLLEKNSYACLSPFLLGKNNIPTKKDMERIISFTSNAFSTLSFKNPRKIKRQSTVEKTIENATVKPLEVLFSSQGHFRFRINPSKPETNKINLFDGAVKLEKNYG